MTIIFADTNKLLLALYKWIHNPSWIYTSWLFQKIQHSGYVFYVSIYVAKELDRVYNHKLWKTDLIEVLKFLDILWCQLVDMEWSSDIYLPYVNDVKDAPILRDAVFCDADFLRTDNLKDFKILEIYTQFEIKVIKYLNQAT